MNYAKSKGHKVTVGTGNQAFTFLHLSPEKAATLAKYLDQAIGDIVQEAEEAHLKFLRYVVGCLDRAFGMLPNLLKWGDSKAAGAVRLAEAAKPFLDPPELVWEVVDGVWIHDSGTFSVCSELDGRDCRGWHCYVDKRHFAGYPPTPEGLQQARRHCARVAAAMRTGWEKP